MGMMEKRPPSPKEDKEGYIISQENDRGTTRFWKKEEEVLDLRRMEQGL